MTQTFVKTGLSAYAETNRLNGKFDHIKMALVPDEALPPLIPELQDTIGITARQARMLRLATPALNEVLQDYTKPVPLYLAGPEPVPNAPLPMRSVFIEHLQK